MSGALERLDNGNVIESDDEDTTKVQKRDLYV